jgi:hypothetical protein
MMLPILLFLMMMNVMNSSYQAFVKKRNNIDISVFNTINNKLIASLYKHIDNDKNYNYKFNINNINYRLIACDGTQVKLFIFFA